MDRWCAWLRDAATGNLALSKDSRRHKCRKRRKSAQEGAIRLILAFGRKEPGYERKDDDDDEADDDTPAIGTSEEK
ncbi:hypothetical protein MMC20_001887, partial [Loxospora ochrophaea]|nr:hypothetical protein [Loxospora ochrophaea]